LKEGVSIIICCYNSSSRIEKTLEHLAKQELNNISCEIILIDNASSDDTSAVAESAWAKIGNNKIDFHLLYESSPGVAFARKRGVNAACFEFLIFCDDDNWLDENYVENTFNLFKLYPEVGVLGGTGTAQFEDPLKKPIWFDNFYHGYAVGPQAEKECFLNNVYGAGMAVRTLVLKEQMKKKDLFLHGRKQNHLSAGEDSEIYLRLRLAGYKILFSPQLTFKHFLSTKRLTWTYVKKLYIGFAYTHVVLNLYEEALASENNELPFFYWLKKAFYHGGIYLKYWPKHYAAYKKGEGTVEEIHHLTWKNIAISYIAYNFETNAIYRKIFLLKKSNQGAGLK